MTERMHFTYSAERPCPTQNEKKNLKQFPNFDQTPKMRFWANSEYRRPTGDFLAATDMP